MNKTLTGVAVAGIIAGASVTGSLMTDSVNANNNVVVDDVYVDYSNPGVFTIKEMKETIQTLTVNLRLYKDNCVANSDRMERELQDWSSKLQDAIDKGLKD